jgi:hypothetical protein
MENVILALLIFVLSKRVKIIKRNMEIFFSVNYGAGTQFINLVILSNFTSHYQINELRSGTVTLNVMLFFR